MELKFREMLLNICTNHNNSDIKNVLYTLSQNVNGAIEQIMEEQYIYNLKVDEFARLCGKSISSFKREFKIQQICYDCGFESDSHFIRSFKNQFGMTPNQWRSSKKSSILLN